jgi:hypothetical protein
MLNHTPSFFIKDAVVDLAPALTTVFAALHATATRGCVDAARVISVNEHRRSQRPVTPECERTGLVLLSIRLSQIKTIFSADVEYSICTMEHGYSFL